MTQSLGEVVSHRNVSQIHQLDCSDFVPGYMHHLFPSAKKKCICVKNNNSKCENKYYISSETKLDVYKYSKFPTGKCDFIQ